MAEYALRFEITNLSGTIYDVQDISSIRGSSYAALKAPEALFKYLDKSHNDIQLIEKKFEGGSQGIYRIVASDETINDLESIIHSWWIKNTIKIKSTEIPLKYLQYTVAILPWQDEPSKQRELITQSGAICKWQQFDLPDFIIPEQHSAKENNNPPYCDIDHARPAHHEWKIFRDLGRDEQTRPDMEVRKTLHLSDYAYSRRNFGASLRPRDIYKDILGEEHSGLKKIPDSYYFTDSFEQIVAKPPKGFEPQLPISLENKMAVVFFDVNGLGNLRRDIHSLFELQTLSEQLHEQRKIILASILNSLCSEENRERWLHQGLDRKGSSRKMVRFETLFWGADEFSWVMPSWLAWQFLDSFFQHTSIDLYVNGEKQTCGHSGGMVICNRRIPIRKAQNIVKNLREYAKHKQSDRDSTLQIEVLESIDIPDGYLDKQRANLFGNFSKSHPELFTLQGETWPKLTEQIKMLKSTLPKSQLRKLIQSAANNHQSKFDLKTAEKNILRELGTLLDNSSYLKPDNQTLLSLEDFQAPLWGKVPLDSDYSGSYLIALYHLDRLWDYVQPFGNEQEEMKV